MPLYSNITPIAYLMIYSQALCYVKNNNIIKNVMRYVHFIEVIIFHLTQRLWYYKH